MEFSEIDKNIFLILNGLHNDFFDVLMTWLSSVMIWVPISLIIAYILIKSFNLRSKKSLFLNILMISLFALFQYIICVKLGSSFFDGLIHRIRPCFDPYISKFMSFEGNDYDSKFGFFSPRTCLSFSIATFLYLSLWDRDRFLKITFIVIAILISYSRIYLGYHYLTNILVSALVGILIGAVSYPIFFFIKNSVTPAT